MARTFHLIETHFKDDFIRQLEQMDAEGWQIVSVNITCEKGRTTYYATLGREKEPEEVKAALADELNTLGIQPGDEQN